MELYEYTDRLENHSDFAEAALYWCIDPAQVRRLDLELMFAPHREVGIGIPSSPPTRWRRSVRYGACAGCHAC